MPQTYLQAWLPIETHRAFKVRCAKVGISMTEQVELLIESFLAGPESESESESELDRNPESLKDEENRRREDERAT